MTTTTTLSPMTSIGRMMSRRGRGPGARLEAIERRKTELELTLKFERVLVRYKREVLEDIENGTIPADVSTASELHDYVDANEYGGACETDPITDLGWWDGTREERDAAVDFWNRVSDTIDLWLRIGGHRLNN